MTARPPAPRRQGCTFEPDDAIPPDWRGRETCRHCHRVGEPGDAGHRPPRATQAPTLPPAVAAAAAERDAAVLGERDHESTDDLRIHLHGRRTA